MKQILHILNKDLRRYAWAWATLLVLASVEVYLQGTTAGLLDTGLNRGLSMLTSMIGGILFFIVIVMVVQEESLADPDAYWLSRPISRGKLLASKLLFLIILIGIYQLSATIVLIMNGGAARTPYALLEIIAALALWQGQVFLAAQTRSLPRYLLLVVCIFVGFYALSFGMLFLTMASESFSFDFDWGQLPADTSEHSLAIIQTIYWLLIGLGALSLIYFRRRILLCWLLLIPAVLIAMILTPRESFLGIDTSMGLNQQEQSLELMHLRKGGTMHTNGQELIEVRAVFSTPKGTAIENIWATVNGPTLRKDGKEIEITSTRSGSQRFQQERAGKCSIRIGYAKRDELAGDEANLAVDFHLDITFSKQVKVGTLPIEEGATYVANGNRLVVRSIYRNEHDLRIELASNLPSFRFEPEAVSSDNEAFSGKFSFALTDANQQHLEDFGLSMTWDGMNTVTVGKIETFLQEDAPLEAFRIAVYAREIISSSWDYVNSSDVSFKK